jgi:hypothetical protein
MPVEDPGWTPGELEDFEAYTEIGKIPKLRKEIDQSHSDTPVSDNISLELKKRMGVIDLIPCNFDLLEGVDLSSDAISQAFKPNIKYESACENFIRIQAEYGFSDPTAFLRVFLTDSTTVQETISNSYTKNIIDDTLNSLTSTKLGQLFHSTFRSVASLGHDDPGSNIAGEKVSAAVNAIGLGGPASKVAGQLAEVLTHGSRISFPKIWAGTEYNPSLTCNIKLMSPYGHPDAIAKFIIEPLGKLLLLLAPRTYSGLTTQRPNFIALKSYGMANMNICSPSVLEIRRGGDDNSYNQYKQPLTVDIAMTFDSVCEGFAAFANYEDIDNPNPDLNLFYSDNLVKNFEKDFETEPHAYFSTMRTMVNSFRPFKYESTVTTQDQQIASPGSGGNENAPDSLTVTTESTTSTDTTVPPWIIPSESSSESITLSI